jgi:hypothetical protein
MPTPRRKTTPSFASTPRNLPDEADPASQPMPQRGPIDPPANVPEPDPPPNGAPGTDSGPLTDTPASRATDLWHDAPPRDPANPDDEDGDDDPDEEAPAEDPDEPDDDENASATVVSAPPPPGTAANHTHPMTVGNVRYEARIQILDAFQYPGGLRDAPGWIDRSWIGYASDEDQLRDIPAGPCLRVPVPSGDIAICRIGDFVAKQEIRMAPDLPGDIKIEVWPKEQFFKLFMPVGS